MTKRAGALAVVALASAAGAAGGCHPLELRRGPACVSGFQPGQNLTVRLGAVYDAKSDFLYKDSWLGPDASDRTPSCMARDGLQTDDVLTFTLTEPEIASTGCSPWAAALQPEAIVSPEVAGGNLTPVIDGVTIARAIYDGTLANHPMFAFRSLVTPSGDPDGSLTVGALPPLAVTRLLSPTDSSASCFDAWVASWEPAP